MRDTGAWKVIAKFSGKGRVPFIAEAGAEGGFEKESESKTDIGFTIKDKTGITDAIRDSLKRLKSKDLFSDDKPSKNNNPAETDEVNLKSTVQCVAAISADEFENLKAKFQKTRMDSEKVNKGKTFFNEKCITSKQAQDLIGGLSLENYKLDFAKFLYGRTLDKAKFMRVANEFAFEGTKKKLQSYIED